MCLLSEMYYHSYRDNIQLRCSNLLFYQVIFADFFDWPMYLDKPMSKTTDTCLWLLSQKPYQAISSILNKSTCCLKTEIKNISACILSNTKLLINIHGKMYFS